MPLIIDVVAPGYGGKPEDIAAVAHYLKKLGFTARIPEDIFSSNLLHSHDDAYRISHLLKALKAKDSAAVWCFKGGYGTAKLIPALSKITPPARFKPLIGFSDITALHLFMNQQWKWPTLHGPVLWQLIHGKVGDTSAEKLKALLLGEAKVDFALTPINKAARDFSGTGKITGGNLALLQTSIGSVWQAKARGKFLLIEEVDEQAYRIDRMLLHLAQAKILDGVKAVLFGDFTFANASEEERKIQAVLEIFAAESKLPVFRLPGIGHAAQNDPIPFGTKATIAKNRLRVDGFLS